MEANTRGTGRLPAAFLTPGSSSFIDFLAEHSPDLLPGRRSLPEGLIVEAPHGTTIVAAVFDGGVVECFQLFGIDGVGGMDDDLVAFLRHFLL